jgi:hypothetical protein
LFNGDSGVIVADGGGGMVAAFASHQPFVTLAYRQGPRSDAELDVPLRAQR